MSRLLNYLPELKVAVFQHLFKFLDSEERQNVHKAYILSHRHRECEYFMTNDACQEFHNFANSEQAWEWTVFRQHEIFPPESSRDACACLSPGEKDSLNSFGEHMKHVSIFTRFYFVEDETYELLMTRLVLGNRVLESVEISVDKDAHLQLSKFGYVKNNHGYFQRPSWSQLMTELKKREGVTVTLKVSIPNCPVDCHLEEGYLQKLCKLFTLPRDDPVCLCLTSWIFPERHPGERSLFQRHPDLTEFPSAMFLAKFPNLQYLRINAANLSVLLLNNLASQVQDEDCPPLQTLSIVINLDNVSHGPLPELTDTAWRNLVRACPALEVYCRIETSRKRSAKNLHYYPTGFLPGQYTFYQHHLELENDTVLLAATPDRLNETVQNPLAQADSGDDQEPPEPAAQESGDEDFQMHPARYEEAGNAVLSVLKRSCPLVSLTLHQLKKTDQNDVIRKCSTFSKTLRFFLYQGGLRSDEGNFQRLITEGFRMKKIKRYVTVENSQVIVTVC